MAFSPTRRFISVREDRFDEGRDLEAIATKRPALLTR
jgi:hypothetical protein